ncbi:putative DNA-binding domain-containing protein [bacterium SCSIO 12844]|nr:putative DNA-binding domain-containing protein [bacterium SCSIO 12844]
MVADFQQLQIAFTKQIRHGSDEKSDLKEVPAERIEVYRSCFISSIKEILTNCFPILSEILKGSRWQLLVENFYAHSHAQTPLFYEVPEEFLSYLLENKPFIDELPFINELAHYEWMELVLDIAEGNPAKPTVDVINFESAKLYVSSLAEVVAYHYKVHHINLSYQPTVDEQVATYLCIYRNDQDQVKFMELNAVSAKFILMLKDKPKVAIKAMQELASELNIADVNQFVLSNQTLVTKLLNVGILFAD